MILPGRKPVFLCLCLILLASGSGFSQLWYLTRGMLAQDERAWGVDTDADGNIYWSVEQKDKWPYWYYNIILYKIAPDRRQLWQSPSWGGAFNDIAFVTKVSGSSVYQAGRIDSTANPNLGDALVVSMSAIDGSYNWHYAYDQGFGYEEIDGISARPVTWAGQISRASMGTWVWPVSAGSTAPWNGAQPGAAACTTTGWVSPWVPIPCCMLLAIPAASGRDRSFI
ncbi:MAG: hypothetical protein NTV01_11785 [Bacteroidia bacterium]|nr:hypothetical protein [Bacteroidia bacterium]